MAGYVDKPAACNVADCKMRRFAKSGSAQGTSTKCKVHSKKPEKGVLEVYNIVMKAVAGVDADASDMCVEVFQEMPINTRSASNGRIRKGNLSRVDIVVSVLRSYMLGIEVNGSKEHQHDPVVRKRDSCKFKAWHSLDGAFDYFVVPGRANLRRAVWLQTFEADLTAAVHKLCKCAM